MDICPSPITYSTSESLTQAKAPTQISPKSAKFTTKYFSNHTVIIPVTLDSSSSMNLISSISSSDSSVDWLRRYQNLSLKFRQNSRIFFYLYGHPFSCNQTLKNYLIMLGLFSVKISDFNTACVVEMFVVNFADFWWDLGWGFRLCEALACGIRYAFQK